MLVALAVVIGAIVLLDAQKGERTFKTDIVKIDTAKVNAISIFPKNKKQEVSLFKEGNDWKVKVNAQKNQTVEPEKISGALKALSEIRATRLAALTTDKWNQFEVDTTSTRVIVEQGGKKTLDLHIGRFSVKEGGREFETFVRLEGEKETYAVNGFLDPQFNTGIDDWRNKIVIKGEKEDWLGFSVSLADGQRYTVEKIDTIWMLDDALAGEGEVNNFFSAISFLSGNNFADDVEETSLEAPDYLLQVNDIRGDKIKVEGFIKVERKILRSSLNPHNLIQADDSMMEKLFPAKEKFESKQDEKVTFQFK